MTLPANIKGNEISKCSYRGRTDDGDKTLHR